MKYTLNLLSLYSFRIWIIGEKPFVCAVCQRGYRDKRELKKHQTSHNHSGQSDPIPGHTPIQISSPISASSSSSSTTAMTASNTSRQQTQQQTLASAQQQQVTKTIIIQQQAPGQQPQTIHLQTPSKVRVITKLRYGKILSRNIWKHPLNSYIILVYFQLYFSNRHQ